MKIVHLVPGSGGSFYCQNCLRDAELIRAQRALGHDAILAPLYLPISAESARVTSPTKTAAPTELHRRD